MKPILSALLLAAIAGPLAAQYRPAGFFGIEGGVMQFYSPKLNGPSGAIRVGSALDRRGLLRASGALSLGGDNQSVYLMAVGHLEFRPLSPRRFSPIIGIGGGMLQEVLDAESQSTHAIGLLVGGIAVRVGGSHTITLRGTYGPSYKLEPYHSIHLGWEFGI